MIKIVLDTSAILALLFDEQGADKAAAHCERGILSTVSYAEAVAKSLDRKVPLETITQSLDGLKLAVLSFNEDHALAAAALRPLTRHLNFSFADRACLATAKVHELPVLTADRDWQKADLGIKIHLIR